MGIVGLVVVLMALAAAVAAPSRGEAAVPLAERYAAYLACLNARDWDRLGEFVADNVVHNGRVLGVAGYRAMLEQDVRDIPDLHFAPVLLVVDDAHVAARLRFDCAPAVMFLGLAVNGRRVLFHEHAIYRFAGGRIAEVFSLIDTAAIEAQLRGG